MVETSCLPRIPCHEGCQLTTWMPWRASLLSQIMAKHLNLPVKDPWAGSSCLPWKLLLDPNEVSLKLTDLIFGNVSSFREASLISMWLSVSATWLCCTHFDGPLDAVVLAAFPCRWWAQCCHMNQMLPYTGPVLGPFLEQVLLVVQKGFLLPWLLCTHRPFSPAIGTVKHPHNSSFQGYVRAATMS